jgi:hypothetical protein
MATKAQVLAQLRRKVSDEDTLQELLKSENLLLLLKHYGYQKASLQQRIKSGTLPGEFLLEVMDQEPDEDHLLSIVRGNTGAAKQRPAQSKTKTGSNPVRATTSDSPIMDMYPEPSSVNLYPDSMSDEGKNLFERPIMRAAVVIVTLTSIFPALMLAGFFPKINIISSPVIGLIVALIGGAVAGGLFAHTTRIARWKGVLMGVVLNIGTLGATILYVQNRSKVFSIEIAIPLALGSLPALALYFVMGRRKDI